MKGKTRKKGKAFGINIFFEAVKVENNFSFVENFTHVFRKVREIRGLVKQALRVYFVFTCFCRTCVASHSSNFFSPAF